MAFRVTVNSSVDALTVDIVGTEWSSRWREDGLVCLPRVSPPG